MTNSSTTIAELRAALRRLAERDSTDVPIVSAFLDLRPVEGSPQVRSGLVVLRDQLRSALADVPLRSPAHESLSADADRIASHVEDDLLPGATGAAVFACGAEDLFVSLVTAEAVTNDVSAGPRARLSPLARLADALVAIVGLADTNTLRIFASRSGGLTELGLLDDAPGDYSLTEKGGWSQARFQRHVEEHREQFADLGGHALEVLGRREGATVLLLAGDEVAVPILQDALSRPMADMLRGVVRCEMRATLEEVEAECLPALEGIWQDDARDLADRVIGAAEGDGMGVFGPEVTRRALELGQVEQLVLDSGPDAILQEETAEDLVYLAAATDAGIRFAEHAGLRERGSVCGLLRFRLDRPANQPAHLAGDTDSDAPTVGPTGVPLESGRSD